MVLTMNGQEIILRTLQGVPIGLEQNEVAGATALFMAFPFCQIGTQRVNLPLPIFKC